MSKEESKSDVVGEAREFISIVGNCGLYPDKAQRLISALCNEVEQLRRDKTFLGERLEAQAETMSRVVAERNQLRESGRVMKEAIEAVIPWIEAEIDSLQCSTHDQPTHCADCALRHSAEALVKQLGSAVTPKGSER